MSRRTGTQVLAATLAAGLAAATLAVATLRAGPALAADPYENAPPYMKRVAPRARLMSVVTVGQQIPRTNGAAGEMFRVVGVTDGMGVHAEEGKRKDARLVLLVNHEFGQGTGGPAGPLPSGARVSEFLLDYRKGGAKSGVEVVSGRYAIERVFAGEPPVPVAAGSRRIARLCSAFLATSKVGFDRPTLLHGEESSGTATFDGRGGQAFATFEGSTYTLPRVGRAAWENVVAVPFSGSKTVLFALEDGPSGGDGLHSQLYMYVGEKVPEAADALSINGLNNGRLYVFAGNGPRMNSEETFRTKGGTAGGRWVEVNHLLNDAGLEDRARLFGAFGFIRIEDGAADPQQPGMFYFVTTGQAGTANPFGRLYRLSFTPGDPAAPATLTILLDGSEGIVGPDNIDVNKHGEIAIQEDPTYSLASLGLTRDTSVWIYDIRTRDLVRVAEVDRVPAKSHARAADPGNRVSLLGDGPGGWETSGIIDAEEFLGRGSWLLNVMAHSLRIVPTSETVEGGQILHLVWKPEDEE